ncbi:triphosphoribosyl-dephospho-CoA synthase CitG [Klebsiella aerogenes]|uniref:triphosphoribosyl-dephospho-CoA synthase CitG n=1 Tax=Klebsiella aerogenes TaxID=548 RepID=UPI002930AE02|nr:triphosphoribosyl-dephospho-CoA synthase CitG [Klebsiella aerogenes]
MIRPAPTESWGAPVARQEKLPQAYRSRYYARLACRAMQTEARLTPKPGLVDRRNSGAHQDMALPDFLRSAHAIASILPLFFEEGAASAVCDPDCVLARLKPIGLRCETAMLQATGGVNTHKGAIFTLGLFCAAQGRHEALEQPLVPKALAATVAKFCHGIVERELVELRGLTPLTAGQRLFITFGLTGARGEAQAGYPLVIDHALPRYRQLRREGLSEELALLNTLLFIMSRNDDTCVASRGGIKGLNWLQRQAQQLLNAGGVRSPENLSLLQQLDDACISRNLSPGGSADLLMLTWFLSHFHQEESQ